ncbi:DoxX family protein [Metabacillus arenae]|uniref:DoxX family protein n=1 Tax=Metabacillus arenae TaxID=2771434 RepID=A0A926NLJ1_9BACI|nr:DoxX family protein [Metabacillus arenae]MBD1383290.1 DoxX family protein [Metabacillus arenae]
MKDKLEIGSLILRVVLGITFAMHGLAKFQGGIGNTAASFESMGIPGFMGYVVGVIELAGGIAVILGLGTKLVSSLFAIILVVATIKVKWSSGFLGGFELDLVLLAISLHLALNGSFLLSLDSLWKNSFKGTNRQIES